METARIVLTDVMETVSVKFDTKKQKQAFINAMYGTMQNEEKFVCITGTESGDVILNKAHILKIH